MKTTKINDLVIDNSNVEIDTNLQTFFDKEETIVIDTTVKVLSNNVTEEIQYNKNIQDINYASKLQFAEGNVEFASGISNIINIRSYFEDLKLILIINEVEKYEVTQSGLVPVTF